MSSSAATAAPPAARCLLCSVGCPVRAVRAGPDQYLPDYVPHAGYAGLCGRGSVLVEWADHPQRLHGAVRRHAALEQPLSVDEAAAEMARALAGARAAAIVVDGNLSGEAIAAAGALASKLGARWAAWLPPADVGLVRGLDGADCATTGPEGLAEADALLVVGDVFASHPVAAHWIFEARGRSPRMPLLMLGSGAGATAKFATASWEPPVSVGAAARAVRAVRTGDASDLGPDAPRLAGWGEQLAKAERPAIVVTADLSACDARLLAVEAAAAARTFKAKLCPLTSYGNAWGAARLAATGGASAVEEVLREPPQVLLTVGVDLASALGAPAAEALLAGAEALVAVAPLPSATTARASIAAGCAFAFEGSGRALLGPGREVSFEPLLAPPAGVPTPCEWMALLGAPESRADLDEAPAAMASEDCGEDEGDAEDGLRLAPAADPFHFADGSLTRLARWPMHVRGRPVIVMAEEDARAAGVPDGAVARIEGPGGAAEAVVATSEAARPGQARVSAAFADVRGVFGWGVDGRPLGAPCRVRVSKA